MVKNNFYSLKFLILQTEIEVNFTISNDKYCNLNLIFINLIYIFRHSKKAPYK